jgi:hypothetical protein
MTLSGEPRATPLRAEDAASKGRIETFMALPLEIVGLGLLSERNEKHAPNPGKPQFEIRRP